MSRIAKIKEFLQKTPDDGFLLHALALEYVKAEDDNEAAKVWEDLLSKQPDYIGSYYHLGKLYERRGEVAKAIPVYEKGMEASKKAGDQHTLNELRAAYEDIEE